VHKEEILSISGLGLYSQHTMDEAIVSQPAQQAKAVVPPGAVDQQSSDALAKASYQPTISVYGQAQNAMAYLRSTVQGMDKSSQSGNASGSFKGQQKSSGNVPGMATRAVQAFVDADNANGIKGAQISEALNGIGITYSNGKLSLNSQAFQKALSSNPENTVRVFSSLAESMQHEVSAPSLPNQPASQYSIVSNLG
jgi:hypothetical protein